jgi:hypothetical protein
MSLADTLARPFAALIARFFRIEVSQIPHHPQAKALFEAGLSGAIARGVVGAAAISPTAFVAAYLAKKQAEKQPPSFRDCWETAKGEDFPGTRDELEPVYRVMCPPEKMARPGRRRKVTHR